MISFQILSCRVEIGHRDPDLADTFRYLATKARQPVSVRKTLRYEVRGIGPYEIIEEGDPLADVATAQDVLHVVYGRVHRRTMERYILAGWTLLHGGLATVNGRRLLFLGDKGAGKTTLATRLLYAGHRVDGDEFVLERDGRTMAFPRNFHLKPGAERHVPELRRPLDSLPRKSMGEVDISALDPGVQGFDWRIDLGPVDAVISISPNHGGATSLTPCPPFQIIQRLLESWLGWGEAGDVLVASASRLGAAGGYELVLGDVADAVPQLEAAFAG